jgi:hypothetical protein
MAIFSVNKNEQKIRILDNFFENSITVEASQWEVVYSFFAANSPNKQAAESFASLLFNIAKQTEIDPLELFAAIKGQNNRLQMNQLICFYLNSFRAKTTIFGVGVTPAPNEAVQRNVVL